MAINVVSSVQCNGELVPDIILLKQYYHHRGTRLNAMKRFCINNLGKKRTRYSVAIHYKMYRWPYNHITTIAVLSSQAKYNVDQM